MKNIDILENQIYTLRNELDNLIIQQDTYDKILDLSRRLDELIVLYINNKKDIYSSNGNILN
ncbi:MAG: Spo0E family sporulation regulatory protein-aspartic acid phosphatase [Thermoanaerobacteraceae bacterium]